MVPMELMYVKVGMKMVMVMVMVPLVGMAVVGLDCAGFHCIVLPMCSVSVTSNVRLLMHSLKQSYTVLCMLCCAGTVHAHRQVNNEPRLHPLVLFVPEDHPLQEPFYVILMTDFHHLHDAAQKPYPSTIQLPTSSNQGCLQHPEATL
mmetsp:Transcript_23152/g.53234  ORF Transcript_23152/g.53234 Transcript_23152/m.53234 type:complete len:147 (-) Transcript_23152:487-927(-)